MAIDPQIAALLRTHKQAIERLQAQNAQLIQAIQEQQQSQDTVWAQINKIPGRWIESTLSGEVVFTASDEGKRGAPVNMLVSQDGPFIWTHYPLCLWRPTAPDNTTNFNRWRPVSSFPLPTQVVSEDIIDIMYEIQDGGVGRNFQNEPRGPLLSRPDNIVPCPTPTLWSPNATILFIPTYLKFTWDSDTPPTQGTLHVDFPGFRISNL